MSRGIFQPMPETGSSNPRPLASALVLITLGLPGVLSLLPALPIVPGAPRLLLLVNPLLFLALAAIVGTWLAPRCGFRSRIAERISGDAESLLPPLPAKMIATGAAFGVIVTLADHALGPLWQARPAFPPSLVEAWSPAALLLGVLYGGIVEEIVMRWGLTSLLVWMLWRIFMRSAERPPQSAVFAGFATAALVFAASHLPALAAAGAEMAPSLVIRTIGFNLLLGLLFGWLFIRRDLESAMLAHVGFHLGVATAALPMRLVL